MVVSVTWTLQDQAPRKYDKVRSDRITSPFQVDTKNE